MLWQKSDIDCNDDNFCLKAGRPAEYIVIQNCVACDGGLFTCGSETSGGIRHVIARNLKAKGTKVGIRIKSPLNRGGTVEDIRVDNIEMDGVGTAILLTMNWNPAYSYSTLPKGYTEATLPAHWKAMLAKVNPEKGMPHFRDVIISNVKVQNARTAISAEGQPNSLLGHYPRQRDHDRRNRRRPRLRQGLENQKREHQSQIRRTHRRAKQLKNNVLTPYRSE